MQLAMTFSEEELEIVIRDMQSNTTPGPNGFPAPFFKCFWSLVKKRALHILSDFILGRVDISRLNYEVLSLIPKMPGVDTIS